jgi:hypothetical protein
MCHGIPAIESRARRGMRDPFHRCVVLQINMPSLAHCSAVIVVCPRLPSPITRSNRPLQAPPTDVPANARSNAPSHPVPLNRRAWSIALPLRHPVAPAAAGVAVACAQAVTEVPVLLLCGARPFGRPRNWMWFKSRALSVRRLIKIELPTRFRLPTVT